MQNSFSKVVLAFLLSVFLFSACKKDKIYSVPANIQFYIDDFINEAAARGVHLDIDDLIVLFEENLEVGDVSAAGLCQRGGRGTPTIKLDTTSINWQLNLSSREQLVFHELGHCVLNRDHIDEKMPNNNYKTTMRASGEQIYGPVYSRFKREYYLDELFDINTPIPNWAIGVSDYSDFSSANKQLDFEEDFNNNSRNWSTGISSTSSRKIENGLYVLEVLQARGLFVDNTLDINTSRDFELEVRLKLNGQGFGGLLWGGENLNDTSIIGNDTIIDFVVPNFKYMYLGQQVSTIGSIFNGTESSYESDLLGNATFYILTVRKLGSNVTHYINGELQDNIGVDELIGNRIGFAFGGDVGVKVEIDFLKLFYLN